MFFSRYNTVPFLLFSVAMGILCIRCGETDESPVIARVGSSVLTLNDLNERIPPEYTNRISREQMINYVKQWMDTELLYQEALRKKIHKEPDIRDRLAKMKKDLLSAEIISRNSFAAGKYTISDDAIRNYYEENKDSFIRESDMVKCMEIVVDDAKTAWQVRNMITDDNFLDLAVRFSRAPVQDPRSVHFVSVSELPPSLADVVPTIRIGGTTVPLKTDDGYHIIRVLDKQDAGTSYDLAEVREDIVSVLSTEAHKRHVDALLSELRIKMNYEFHFERIPDDENGGNEQNSEEQ